MTAAAVVGADVAAVGDGVVDAVVGGVVVGDVVVGVVVADVDEDTATVDDVVVEGFVDVAVTDEVGSGATAAPAQLVSARAPIARPTIRRTQRG
jgi:hypothetical protein